MVEAHLHSMVDQQLREFPYPAVLRLRDGEAWPGTMMIFCEYAIMTPASDASMAF